MTYKHFDEGKSCRRIPNDFIPRLTSNDILTTSNPEVIIENNRSAEMIITLKGADGNYLKTMNNFTKLTVEIDPNNVDQSIKDVKKQVAIIRSSNKNLKLVYVGNLPFGGTEAKLWMLILKLLTQAGFDEIHLIIAAKSIPGQSKEHKAQKDVYDIEGLSAIHFIRPEQFDDIQTPTVQIVIKKGYDGPVRVYDEFRLLYSSSMLDTAGRQNTFAPVDEWPSFIKVLEAQIQNSMTMSEYISKSCWLDRISLARLEDRNKDYNHKSANSILDFSDPNNIIYGAGDYAQKNFMPKTDCLIFKPRMSIANGFNSIISQNPVSVHQACCLYLKGANQNVNYFDQFMKTSWGKFYSYVCSLMSPTRAPNAASLKFVSMFDFSKPWSEARLDKIHGANLTAIKNNVLMRYKKLYG